MSVVHLGPPNRSNATGRHYKSAAFEEKVLIRTGKGVLTGFTVANKNGSAVYVYICDIASASGALIGNTLVPPVKVAATDGIVSFDDLYGKPFTTGLVIALSSTFATYTALGSADGNFLVDYAIDTSTPTTDA